MVYDSPLSRAISNKLSLINYTRAEQYFEEMKKSIAQHNYEWALECIELALCCEPNKSDYYRWRREILNSYKKRVMKHLIFHKKKDGVNKNESNSKLLKMRRFIWV